MTADSRFVTLGVTIAPSGQEDPADLFAMMDNLSSAPSLLDISLSLYDRLHDKALEVQFRGVPMGCCDRLVSRDITPEERLDLIQQGMI